MPTELPACCPYLFYEDLPRAIDFLKRAFALEERRVERNDLGNVEHAQLGLGAAVVMLGATGSWPGYRSRKSPEALGGLNAGVYLFVGDVDSHAARARAVGAKVQMEPADMPWGDRLYCAEDIEGQFWMFATRSSCGMVEA